MKLIKDWKQVLSGAWSVRLMMIAAIVSALGVFLSIVSSDLLGWNPIWFAVVASVFNVLAIPARVIMQEGIRSFQSFRNDECGAVGRRGAIAGASAAVVMALATPFIAQWEGVRLEAYKDIVGVETICFGDTQGVRLGDTATMDECVARLQDDVESFYADIAGCMTNPDIPAGVQASMLELAYNVGSPNVCRSTMMRKANAGDYIGACNELRRWVNAGGQRIRGLTNRRADSKQSLCLHNVSVPS
ncbi:lysozyme [Parasedimentitalea psychrophila]|uniref:Lysozyme n=1 Tax=Parasedimentitalea psychrophila TaxID=2997337 RepID=A0A9Y2P306_9RHOB|nr:lysozyme [Parasedimentitalea psychrophila]WIY23774.1 lysozyme [Parasedimentitalea psychrophila]